MVSGRFTNTNLAEYMIPVNLDVPVIDVTFLDDPDPFINPAGVKGVGEIGITGVAAAIRGGWLHRDTVSVSINGTSAG